MKNSVITAPIKYIKATIKNIPIIAKGSKARYIIPTHYHNQNVCKGITLYADLLAHII